MAARLAQAGIVRDAVAALAQARGRGLVLLYHRVLPESVAAASVVPSVTPDTLGAHIDAARRFGDLAAAADLLCARRARGRVKIAISFDDDDPSHLEYALPVLQRCGVTATFFMSGRALHGLPGYWWQQLEAAVAREGVAAVGRHLKVRGTIAEIVQACEQPEIAARLADFDDGRRTGSGPDAIRRLADAGMEIGFHTLRHPVLPMLTNASLDAAMRDGRDALAQAARREVRLIAYPHGRADARVASAARRAGFTAGFITGGRAIGPRTDPLLLPRWEPGAIDARAFTAEALLRLHAAARRAA